ncbi:shikimate dehydrogenase [Methanocella sp. CWC-04]|uniref:Shikimate dehydrogenase (NADP(+)) n=1 Tax=Methanooceanicella nereidis TaxID=2052831 RepID=A0AAP2W5U5_9EURY|nr:shikimate dehydrogenase [Methanocella sp. CWC-04]MCD1294673.1 shikimate dehydrogenase [Methanocella sp. CWC-04]
MKKVFGVIGDPISHSLSPVMHNAAFDHLEMDCAYHAFQVKGEHLREAIVGARYLGFGGLNVTIPHKEEVLKIVEGGKMASDIGAANTIDFRRMKAFNTDGPGALDSLQDNGIDVSGKDVLVLGAGGAARAIVYIMAISGARVTVLNRTEDKSLALASHMSMFGNVTGKGLGEIPTDVSASDVIINTTSVGMYPDVDGTLVTSDMLDSSQVVFDLVYKPLETRLLKEARMAGAKTIDGITMLVRQGARSFEIWNDVRPPVDVMERSVRDVL